MPILRDFRPNRTRHSNYHLLRSGQMESSLVYAYCSKSLLPIDFAIVEEQARAKKWISDLFARRNAASASQPLASTNVFVPGLQQQAQSQQQQPQQQQQMLSNHMNGFNNGAASNQMAVASTTNPSSTLINPMVGPNPIGNINMTLNNPLTNAPMHTFFHSSLSVPNFATSSKLRNK